jgi:toxin ParE1/3/4
MSYKISKRADSDIDEIWDYIATDNPEAADRFERDLRELFQIIARLPNAGRNREDLAGGSYRSWPFRAYVIIYRVHGRQVTVVRVIHGARDLRKLFKKK